nr:DUF5131 family protein [Candidatus Sigynarchaeota archaeon]
MHEAKSRKITTGTKEWADHNANCIDGCSHDCRYCYAKKMAIRFKRATADTWRTMKVREHDVKKGYRRKEGRIMFPTSHDIVPDEPCFTACMTILRKLLAAGNNVLVTTKPHLKVIEYICTNFTQYKKLIQFRFTITSMDEKKLSYWEPGAPGFSERIEALKFAFHAGFKTSISIEPCLDDDPRELVAALQPFVTESIWLGIMNYCGSHAFTSTASINNWIAWLSSNPLVRFKDSVKKRIKIKDCTRFTKPSMDN